MDLSILLILALAIAVFVNAAFGAVKVFLAVAPRFIPPAAVITGVVVALILQPFTPFDFYTMGVAGGLAGLSACGLFDVKKALATLTKGGDKQ